MTIYVKAVGIASWLDVNRDDFKAHIPYQEMGKVRAGHIVPDCAITYDAISQRYGLVTIRLGIMRGGESVSLYQEIHVNNVP